MKVFIKYRENNPLPDIEDLVKIMWNEGISFSKVADDVRFKNCTTLSLAWDKWLDDKRWVSHPKFKEYIYFDIERKDPLFFNKISLEIDDNAIEVDKRAFYKAVIYISEKVQGEISINGTVWLDSNDYAKTVNEYLKLSFEKAIELSLSH